MDTALEDGLDGGLDVVPGVVPHNVLIGYSQGDQELPSLLRMLLGEFVVPGEVDRSPVRL